MDRSRTRNDDVYNDLFENVDTFSHGSTTHLLTDIEAETFPNDYAKASQARTSDNRAANRGVDGSGKYDSPTALKEVAEGAIERSPPTKGSHVDSPVLEASGSTQVLPRKNTSDPKTRLESRMMTVGDVAAHLSVSVSTIWRLTKERGGFPSPIRIGNSTRWDRQSIDLYLDRLQAANSPVG